MVASQWYLSRVLHQASIPGSPGRLPGEMSGSCVDAIRAGLSKSVEQNCHVGSGTTGSGRKADSKLSIPLSWSVGRGLHCNVDRHVG